MNDIAATIDHTLLKSEATIEQIDALIDEALRHGFAGVCVNGCFVEHAAGRLGGSRVRTCAVAGFPLGAMRPGSIAQEAAELVRLGAGEIDFVAPLRHLMRQETDAAADAMRCVVEAVRRAGEGVAVKVIIESAALMKDVEHAVAEARVRSACEAARRAGCDFVKTSTGFHPAGGATIEAVTLMRKHAGGLKVKAAGGIRSAGDAGAMLAAGADRLGCSCGVAIVQQRQSAESY